MLKILGVFAVLLLISCHNASQIGPEANSSNNAKGEPAAAPPGISVGEATLVECAAGGKVYSVYLDNNSNGSLDEEERIISRQIVCGGVAGNNGTDGLNGDAGFSMVFQTVIATAPQCLAGGVTLLMALDADRSGALSVPDENLQSVTICNGVNGADGQNGAPAPVSGFTPVDSIAACGNTVSFKEILLRLQNGQVLGSFSNSVSGDMTRLAFLPDGVFMNTDNSGCVFTLSTSADAATRSISWSGQVQQTWSLF